MKLLKFIHITKCAGRFIENMGFKNNIKWGIYHTQEYGYWHDIFFSKSRKLKDKYDWFMIVRNPYDRILSEYYCEWGGIGYKNINHTQEQFNNYLIDKIKKRSLSGDHYTEQYKYMDFETVIHVIKIENINKKLPSLFKEYEIDIDITKYKVKNTKYNKNSKIRFTVNDFNHKLIHLINKVYHKDFFLFNYQKKKV